MIHAIGANLILLQSVTPAPAGASPQVDTGCDA